MAKHLKYFGEFVARDNAVWRVELWQESETAFDPVGELTFEADAPLLLEWGETAKEDVLQGCMATLAIESPGDRTYEGMYTTAAGSVRMDVYRTPPGADGRPQPSQAGSLYWTGCMDTEFYEEPYERAARYPVELKFSDLGIWGRLKYNMAGMQSVQAILADAMSRADLEALSVDTSCVSTRLDGEESPLDFSALQVDSGNFYDEDGEAMALDEVLEGIFQPLGIRVAQRAGKLWLYDLNGLHAAGRREAVQWDGSTQTLGVDKAYNNAKVTWSPYARTGNLLPAECWLWPAGDNYNSMLISNNGKGGTTTSPDGTEIRYFTYHYGTAVDDWNDTTGAGFTLLLAKEGKNATLYDYAGSDGAPRFFKVVPQLDGQECEGIALMYRSAYLYDPVPGTGRKEVLTGVMERGLDLQGTQYVFNVRGQALFKSAEAWIGPANASSLLVRVGIEMMMDPRPNPFEEAMNWSSGLECKDWQAQWNSRGNYVYVPIRVLFQPEGSGKVYYWDNKDIVLASLDDYTKSLKGTLGRWKELTESVAGTEDYAYFAWYDPTDLKDSSGTGGWQMNRPAINPHEGGITAQLREMDGGQYIPYPTALPEVGVSSGGRLWVEVLNMGWMIYDAGTSFNREELSNPHGLWGTLDEETGKYANPKISHVWMKLPEVEVVNNRQFAMEIEDEEVEYSAELDPAAKEELEIDTICGTSAEGVPTARGAYFAGGQQVRQFARAGRTAPAEELLIGTLYSQYARRHATLEGEAALLASGLRAYTEQNQSADRVFLLVADTQDAQAATSEAKFVELSPDEYDGLRVDVETGSG